MNRRDMDDLSSVSDEALQNAVDSHPSSRTVRLCREEIRRRRQIGIWTLSEESDD